MLVRLLYASRAAADGDVDTLPAIVRQSKESNLAAGITGVLCFCPAARVFLQVLEGGRLPVSALYHRIARDPRHRDVVLLGCEEIGERRFARWSLGQVNTGRLNASLLLKYSESAVLDPYAVSGAASLALFDELVATASVGAPG